MEKMNTTELDILKKNHSFLKSELDIDSVRSFLYEKDILTDDDMEKLKNPHTTRSNKVETFLIEILPKRGPNAYREFINALEEHGYSSHIIETLKNTKTKLSGEDENNEHGGCGDSEKNEQGDSDAAASETLVLSSSTTISSHGAGDGIRYDLALFFAEESETDAKYFQEFLEKKLRNSTGEAPKIFNPDYYSGAWDNTKINSLKYGLDRSKYYLLYIDRYFVYDKWSAFMKEQCLWQHFKSEQKSYIVPVFTNENLQCPFGLITLKPIKLWKITEGRTMKDFVESGAEISGDGVQHLKKLREWFVEMVIPKRDKQMLQTTESFQKLALTSEQL